MLTKTLETYNQDGTLLSSARVEVSTEEHNALIKRKLESIDARSIRALRAGDSAKLAELEQEAEALRATLL